jgi:ADP-ribosylglycohydrolase
MYILDQAVGLCSADRVFGAFLGQAVGDAIGFALGASDLADGQIYADQWREEGYPEPIAARGYGYGQVGHITQFSLHLARSLNGHRGFSAADYVNRLASDLLVGRLVGFDGAGSMKLAADMGSGMGREDGIVAPGNVAAQRAWVPAAVCSLRSDLERVTRAHAGLTDRGPQALDAAILVAHAARHLIEGGRLGDMLFAVEDRVSPGARSRNIIGALQAARSLLDESSLTAASFMHRLPFEWNRDMPGGLVTVVRAFWSAIKGAGNPLEAIRLGVSCGAADGTAALAGCLAGASHGGASFPGPFANLVENHGTKLRWEFCLLASKLAD